MFAPIAAAEALNIVAGALTLLCGTGGFVAFLRYRPDTDRVIVSQAEGLHTIQSGIIDALQEELQRNRVLREQAEGEMNRCRDRIDELEDEVDQLKGQIRELRRVAD